MHNRTSLSLQPIQQMQLVEAAQNDSVKIAESPDNGLIRELGKPALLAQASEALPLLLYVLAAAAGSDEAPQSCELILKDVAADLGISASTITVWHHRLTEQGLLRSQRCKGFVRFTVAPPLCPTIVQRLAVNPAPERQVGGTDLGDTLLADVLLRLRRLECRQYDRSKDAEVCA